MFKAFLNEYCQSKAWIPPEYRIKREGPAHRTRWKGLVVVNGETFISPDFCKTSKEAQDVAAKLAFEHFSDMSHMYKLQLQIYAQKRGLRLPVYHRVGPFHSFRFKSKVKIAGKAYESGAFFHTLKEAENAAAKVALDSITSEVNQKDDRSNYKNLLQEFLQKQHSSLPTYTTVQEGQSHVAVFHSTVAIQGEAFRGQEAYTKKQAEMNAAKVAYIALTERKFKKDDEHNVVGATTPIMETPKPSPANMPVAGTTNTSMNIRSFAKPMTEKQIRSVEGIGIAATPNAFTRTRGATTTCQGSIGNLKATSSVPRPTCYPKTPPSSILKSKPMGGSRSDVQKTKTGTMILPQSVSSNSEDLKPFIHNQKTPNIPPQIPIKRATTKSGQLATPSDASVCIWLIPKEETETLILPPSVSSSSEDVKPVIRNQKDLNIPPPGHMRATTSNLGQLAKPSDASVCPLHGNGNEKWLAIAPKEEPYA